MLTVTTLLAAALLGPAGDATAPAPCAAMMTDRMPLASRKSPMDSVVTKVGGVEVKLCYGRPSLRGRKAIGGELVPFGKLWRTGANEPTVLHTDGGLTIAGVEVPAGSYSIYTVPGPTEWEVIVNRSVTQWGHESAYSDAVKAQEVGRGKVKAEALKAPVEQLTFSAQGNSLVLEWESTRVRIPLTPKK